MTPDDVTIPSARAVSVGRLRSGTPDSRAGPNTIGLSLADFRLFKQVRGAGGVMVTDKVTSPAEAGEQHIRLALDPARGGLLGVLCIALALWALLLLVLPWWSTAVLLAVTASDLFHCSRLGPEYARR